MKYKSHIISQGSGKIAGAVYSHNRSGMYIRNLRIPVNTPTDRRTDIRSILTSLVTAWTSQLTPTQQAAWAVYAANVPKVDRLGDSIQLSPQNWFIGANSPRLQAGLARIDNAPTVFDRGFYTPPTVAVDATGQNLMVSFNEADPWVTADGTSLNVYIAKPINGSRTFFKGPYVLAAVVDGDAGTPPTSPVTVPLPFPVAPNQQLGSRFSVSQADGRYGTPTLRLTPTVADLFVLSVAILTPNTARWFFSGPVTTNGDPVAGLLIGNGGSFLDATGLATVPGIPNAIDATYGTNFQEATLGQSYNLTTSLAGMESVSGQPITTPEAATAQRVYPVTAVTATGVSDATWSFAPRDLASASGASMALWEIDAQGLGFIGPSSITVSAGKLVATYAVAPQSGDAWRLSARPGVSFVGDGIISVPANGVVA